MSRYGHDPIDFGSLDDEYRGYDDRAPEGGRGPLILALAAGVLIVFAAVVWNTYRQGIRTDASPLPVITADAPDFKRLPDDAGGFEVPDQDRHIYDAFETDVEGVELRNTNTDTLSGGPAESRQSTDVADVSAATANVEQADLRRLTAIDEPAVRLQRPVSEVGMAPQPTLPVPDPTVTAAQFEFSSNGAYLVQIAALRNEAGALRAWEDAVNAHPAIFAGAAQSVQRADLGSRGIFYRLRAGRFSDRDSATAFCSALKEVGRDCIVVR